MQVEVETERENELDMPRAFRLDHRRVAVAEILDQWFGEDYRYCKLKGDDGAVYILRVVEHRAAWELTMFARAKDG
jgi:elongation factor P hydroxylase